MEVNKVNLDKMNPTVENTFVTWSRQKNWNPIKIVGANGCYFKDVSGKSYLDMSSQLMCSNLGQEQKNN